DATITVAPQTRTARYVARWCCMTGPATAAHFHRAAQGESGPVVHALTMNTGDSVVEGVWSGLSDQDIADIRTGNIYLNVHTAQYPNGEIRGQVIPIAAFTAAVSSKNEVPETSASAEGTGIVIAFGQQSQEFPLFGEFVVEGLTGDITAAHIHRGAIGANGGVAFDLATRTYPNMWWLESRISDPTNRAELIAGRMYANFHTAQNQNGEARGQLVPALLNWDAISAAPLDPVTDPVTGEAPKLLSAFDQQGNRLLFHWNGRNNEEKVRLFNLLGHQVAEATLTDGTAAINAASLPAAPYFAQLLVEGTPVAVGRVIVATGTK
ncbi:MAG: CHRD domain-containing protein, partial [Armatimonadetes bacterium]|nr:CHRD domain-containing protein [Armatimonadota bacterium]